MFSPAIKKSSLSARKNVATRRDDDSPLVENRRPPQDSPSGPNRPATGTPAPWASRLSVLARIPPVKKSEREADVDAVKPVYVGEFPQIIRDAQAMLLQNHAPADASISGGMDKETNLAWIICNNTFFIWNYLSPASSRNCVVLDLPKITSEDEDSEKSAFYSNSWLVSVINWESSKRISAKAIQQPSSVGMLICNKKTRSLIFWPDIYDAERSPPLTNASLSDEPVSTYYGKSNPSKQRQHAKFGNNFAISCYINSLIASPVPATTYTCIAIACSSNGALWRFQCSPSGIKCDRIDHTLSNIFSSIGYPRSLTWHSFRRAPDDPNHQFLLLTDHEIQCFSVKLSSPFNVLHLWSHEIIGIDGDLGIQKDLAGQKKIWPLSLDVDTDGKVMTILIAIFCKDRVTSSSYTEYSILTMHYKSGVDIKNPKKSEQILEKKAPIQVIIPKARVEDEDFLLSMRLKVGGKPNGSCIILSGDGTATVSHYWRNSTKLYQFDLPYDAGKVLDTSIFPSTEENEEGAWVVLTEKAGVWAIPEKAVLLGGVEPPDRSLSRKGSSNEGTLQEERRNLSSAAGGIAPRRASSEAWNARFTEVARRSPHDEDLEALLSQQFNDFLSTGVVDGVLDKLKNSRAFEREGEVNVFSRTSKSIVDTLPKHWTATRGTEIVLSVVSTQLVEKQQKHQKFLQFIALSKCHEELCSRQRQSLQIIMEHGEKLVAMTQLRELQNTISQSTAPGLSYYGLDTRISGPLWDLIQLVGEKSRRNTVLLMDRDNAEVFYSKISDLEEFFNCLDTQLEYIINEDMPILVQFQRAREIAIACVTIFRAAMEYRTEHDMWYPPHEGLTPWYSKIVVWSGLWSVANFMIRLLSKTNGFDDSVRLDLFSNLEVLSEVLLESYANAVSAKDERKEEHRSLLDEYWKRRDALLDSLYKEEKKFVDDKIQDSIEEDEDQKKEMLIKVSSRLLSIAKRHGGYQTMWSICCDLNDSEILRSLMHESMGSQGGFCSFVFQQLYDSKQFSKLLRLGEEFQEEVATFLKQHPHLLWLHEIFLQQFSSASETLHALSLSSEDRSISSVSEIESNGPRLKSNLAKRKHFLNLAKISTMAGRNVDFEVKMKRIEADLNILQLQEEILSLMPDDEEKQSISQILLPPVHLIELCLKIPNRELSLRAFDIFSWTSPSFLRSNTSLLEECWRNAANQDDWEMLHQNSINEGWSDEKTSENLRETVIFQASSKCYGPEMEAFESRFDEVLPLRQENCEVLGLSSSVESVLMQHKDFPDAGKLMITAIMLGSVWIVSEYVSPME